MSTLIKPPSIDTSDVTATASDVKAGKKFIDADGDLVDGTYAGGTNGVMLPSFTIRTTRSHPTSYSFNEGGADGTLTFRNDDDCAAIRFTATCSAADGNDESSFSGTGFSVFWNKKSNRLTQQCEIRCKGSKQVNVSYTATGKAAISGSSLTITGSLTNIHYVPEFPLYFRNHTWAEIKQILDNGELEKTEWKVGDTNGSWTIVALEKNVNGKDRIRISGTVSLPTDFNTAWNQAKSYWSTFNTSARCDIAPKNSSELISGQTVYIWLGGDDLPELPKSFIEYTWQEIKDILDAGELENYPFRPGSVKDNYIIVATEKNAAGTKDRIKLALRTVGPTYNITCNNYNNFWSYLDCANDYYKTFNTEVGIANFATSSTLLTEADRSAISSFVTTFGLESARNNPRYLLYRDTYTDRMIANNNHNNYVYLYQLRSSSRQGYYLSQESVYVYRNSVTAYYIPTIWIE